MIYWSQKNQNVSISSDTIYDSIAYDPVKTALSESEAEAEEQTKHKKQTLWLVYENQPYKGYNPWHLLWVHHVCLRALELGCFGYMYNSPTL